MKSIKDIADAAALIAGALDGFDAAEVDKAIAAARALRGSTETIVQPTFVPVPYIPPSVPPIGEPFQPWWTGPTAVYGQSVACAPTFQGTAFTAVLGGPACVAANPSAEWFERSACGAGALPMVSLDVKLTS